MIYIDERQIDNYCMKQALIEAHKASLIDEIPVGAVLYSIDEKKIISRSYNKKEKSNLVIDHAEINVITKANKKRKNWRLINTILYSTLEPCNMCKEVIKESKVSKVVYGAKSKGERTCENYYQIEDINLIKQCEEIIINKFNEIRNSKNL